VRLPLTEPVNNALVAPTTAVATHATIPETNLRAAAQPSGNGDGATHSHPVTRHRVLVVDDNVDAADSLTLLLRLYGHDVRTVHDGFAALEAARTFRPEIVLLDIGLPGMDGYEVARRLRNNGDGYPFVLAAISGYGQERDLARSRQAGFDQHLVKPIDP